MLVPSTIPEPPAAPSCFLLFVLWCLYLYLTLLSHRTCTSGVPVCDPSNVPTSPSLPATAARKGETFHPLLSSTLSCFWPLPRLSSISLGQWETLKDPFWQSCPNWEQRAAHHAHSTGISTGAHAELELGSQELAAAGPNSVRRGNSWHRCCVLPTRYLCGSLCGWRTRKRYLFLRWQ